ncbi:arrestin domain-containing protein 3 isoform X2 [Anabrus simplex]
MVYYSCKDGNTEKVNKKSETYFEEKIIIWPPKDKSEDKIALGSGTQSLPFQFKLPENIPSSIESPEGYVRYSVSAELNEKDLTTKAVKIYFTVNAILDLNTHPRAKQPSSVWTYRDVCCFCFAASPLSAVVHTPRRGYVPGECILLSAEINNQDRRPVSYVKASLMQVVKYSHKNVTRKIKRVVGEVTRGCIMPHESQFWLEETILIPPVPASCLQYCNLMSVWYKVYFSLYQSEFHTTTLKLPVVIGTVPLKQYINTFERGCGDAPLPGEDWPSPNHESCFFGPHNVVDSSGDAGTEQQCSFTPLYITYPAIQDDVEL